MKAEADRAVSWFRSSTFWRLICSSCATSVLSRAANVLSRAISASSAVVAPVPLGLSCGFGRVGVVLVCPTLGCASISAFKLWISACRSVNTVAQTNDTSPGASAGHQRRSQPTDDSVLSLALSLPLLGPCGACANNRSRNPAGTEGWEALLKIFSMSKVFMVSLLRRFRRLPSGRDSHFSPIQAEPGATGTLQC